MPMSSTDSRSERLARIPLDSLPGTLFARARQLAKLRDALANALPAEEAAHLVGVSADAKRIVIFADSPAWCTRMRYCTPQLEAAARTLRGIPLQFAFRTQPARFRCGETPTRSPLSERAIATLVACARTTTYPALAAALRRLAGRPS